MSGLEVTMRYPLLWPNGRPRTADRKPALFRHEGSPITFDRARRRIREQLDTMTRAGRNYRTTDVILSCNIRFTQSGARDRNFAQRDPDDVGVALYFNLDGRPHVLACDRWDTVAGNAAAIAAHIDALRGQERWGVADLAQAFAGHAALPPPDPWWSVLDIPRTSSIDEIHAAYRHQARFAHPNAGGQRAAWDRLSAAYDAAKAEKGR